MPSQSAVSTFQFDTLAENYCAVRAISHSICAPLEAEDYVIQTMPSVSPLKWHLAHTTWFFDIFILAAFQKKYRPFHPQYDYLFNSYYITHGTPFLRSRRGWLSRPTVADIYRYRAWVDEQMMALLANAPADTLFAERIVLGIQHEQQHQELMLTDIKHVFAHNPLFPVYSPYRATLPSAPPAQLKWLTIPARVYSIGTHGKGFAYDNEKPRHKVYVHDFSIADRLITNGEYLEFMQDGGYSKPQYWLADAWQMLQEKGWQAPLYWQKDGEQWQYFTLSGLQPIDWEAPVCHVSHFEADAYARWAKARLPTEMEWEIVAPKVVRSGNFYDRGYLRPINGHPSSVQFYGDVWEWTASNYTGYPGFHPSAGAVGEYNGKFMTGQMVLRGGSCVTSHNHMRPTYRNFFYPWERWQFSGIRLAR